MTTYALRAANPATTKADAVVVGVLSGSKAPELAPGGEQVAAAYGRKLRPLLAALGVRGSAGEVTKVPTSGALGTPLLILVGLGSAVDVDGVRAAAGAAARAATNTASVALALPADSPELIAAATEGWLLGGYRFTDYKRDSQDDAAGTAGELVVVSPIARRQEAAKAFAEAQLLVEAVATTRDWVNTPPGDLTPPVFADTVLAACKALGRGSKVKATVFDEVKLAELGCGGILGVGAASAAPPRLVEITYTPKAPVAHVALVGKGITYDSGGLTIKPGGSMATMKSDMAGAAAVVQATLLAARLELPVRISTFVPMAENMISGTAMRPGDVLTIYGGTTVEVSNTDAEGRLVLADALVRAVETEPDAIIDVATLTGAMVVALGEKITGVMGTDEMVEAILAASRTAGEPHWHMPIPEEMSQRIRSSKIADIAQHDWVRWGGGLFAAAFLREFTAGRPWAHLDIAGPSFVSGTSGHLTAGGTGVGVSTLVEYLRGVAGRA